MLGTVIDINGKQSLLLLKVGEAWLVHEISTVPIVQNDTISMLCAPESVFLGQSYSLSLVKEHTVVTVVDDAENTTRNLLYDPNVSRFVIQLLQAFQISAPPWITEETKSDLLDFLRWRNGEVPDLIRRP